MSFWSLNAGEAPNVSGSRVVLTSKCRGSTEYMVALDSKRQGGTEWQREGGGFAIQVAGAQRQTCRREL